MIEGIPRISVYIITYNQEEVIERTLESILNQKDYVYEICVSDDCSTDKTWEILNEYSQNYPELFKLNRNEPNLGIFENTEKVWTMPTGDIVSDLAGDDSVGDGFFKAVIEFINEHKIDYKNELFAIYGDYVVEYPNGDTKLCRNKAIGKYPKNALSLAWRNLIAGRAICFSINVLRKFEKVSQGRSHKAEFLQDRMLQIYAENNYYIPVVGNIYYAGLGVSSRLDEDTLNEREQILPYAENYLDDNDIKISNSDRYYGRYVSALIAFRFKRSFHNLIDILSNRMRSIDLRYCFDGGILRSFLFALLRRLPHKKPLHF